MPAPLSQPFPIGREDLNPVILAILGDVEIPLRVDDHVGRIAEPPGSCPLNAVADLKENLPLGRVDKYPVKMRVRHQQPSITIHRQTARPVDVEVGRPPTAKILAVAVEDLDSIGEVGDKEMVGGVKRGDPWLVHPTRLGTVNSPDEFGLGFLRRFATEERNSDQTESKPTKSVAIPSHSVATSSKQGLRRRVNEFILQKSELRLQAVTISSWSAWDDSTRSEDLAEIHFGLQGGRRPRGERDDGRNRRASGRDFQRRRELPRPHRTMSPRQRLARTRLDRGRRGGLPAPPLEIQTHKRPLLNHPRRIGASV